MAARRTTTSKVFGVTVLVAVLAVMYAPVVMVFAYSFNESRLGSVWTSFSVQSYRALFQKRDLWDALKTSLLVGTAVSTLSLVFGTLAALGLQDWRRRPRLMAEGLIAMPLVVPDIILGISLAVFFYSIGVKLSLTTVILAQAAFGLSYAFVVVSAAVKDLDPNIHAAALDCGATRWRAFWLVTVPLLAPSLLVAWLFVFSLSFDDFLITFFTKGTGNDTLPIKIYAQMRFGVRPETNALFVVLFVATSAVIAAAWLRRRTSRV
jgi:ABC-type spermidine/putrescine transport system permease subunit II